ncbi:hypothetical protein [Anatilimnocola aggregata]|nr:hypothetical protein [Anatilimnocola aggregata]
MLHRKGLWPAAGEISSNRQGFEIVVATAADVGQSLIVFDNLNEGFTGEVNRFVVVVPGADAKTGAEQRVRISADNESAALTLAKQRGIYPYKLERDLAAEQDEFERILEAEAEEQKRIEEAEARSRVEAIKNRLQSRLREGHSVFLYDTVYLPVDSELLGEQMNIGFDIPGVRKLGLLGWEVVQVVPRTVGIGLENICGPRFMRRTRRWKGRCRYPHDQTRRFCVADSACLLAAPSWSERR